MSAQLPDAATAYQTLFDTVHANVFFRKCAAAGFYPRTQEEADYMLKTAGTLRELANHQQVKAAAAQDNPYYQMMTGLDAVAQLYGLAPARPAHVEIEAGYKQAADAMLDDPSIYNAVLALKADEGERLKAEFAAHGR